MNINMRSDVFILSQVFLQEPEKVQNLEKMTEEPC